MPSRRWGDGRRFITEEEYVALPRERRIELRAAPPQWGHVSVGRFDVVVPPWLFNIINRTSADGWPLMMPVFAGVWPRSFHMFNGPPGNMCLSQAASLSGARSAGTDAFQSCLGAWTPELEGATFTVTGIDALRPWFEEYVRAVTEERPGVFSQRLARAEDHTKTYVQYVAVGHGGRRLPTSIERHGFARLWPNGVQWAPEGVLWVQNPLTLYNRREAGRVEGTIEFRMARDRTIRVEEIRTLRGLPLRVGLCGGVWYTEGDEYRALAIPDPNMPPMNDGTPCLATESCNVVNCDAGLSLYTMDMELASRAYEEMPLFEVVPGREGEAVLQRVAEDEEIVGCVVCGARTTVAFSEDKDGCCEDCHTNAMLTRLNRDGGVRPTPGQVRGAMCAIPGLETEGVMSDGTSDGQ